jgi:hypothetical protein
VFCVWCHARSWISCWLLAYICIRAGDAHVYIHGECILDSSLKNFGWKRGAMAMVDCCCCVLRVWCHARSSLSCCLLAYICFRAGILPQPASWNITTSMQERQDRLSSWLVVQHAGKTMVGITSYTAPMWMVGIELQQWQFFGGWKCQ